jgi:hypothetical protein
MRKGPGSLGRLGQLGGKVSGQIDVLPDPYHFNDVTGATLNTQYTSNTITVTGINGTAAVTVTGGTYSKNGGAYTSSAGTAVNGDQFSVRRNSSTDPDTTVDVVLNIGTTSDTFSISTAVGAVNNDLLSVTVMDATPVVTSPTNLVNLNGYGLKLVFKGMSIGQTFDPTKLTLTVQGAGFDSTGGATTPSRTVKPTIALRLPVDPDWTTGEVVAINDRRIRDFSGSTKFYRATTAGTCGATAPTHTTVGQVVTDGGVSWECIGSASGGFTLPKMEIQNGADAEIYVVLDQTIHAGETITAVNASANLYGASRAGNVNIITKTNNSTIAQYQPVITELTQPYQRVTSSLRAELVVGHPFGQSGRMAACVQFRVIDLSNGNTVLTPAKVTSMVRSTISTAGNIVQVFGQTIDISSLSDGWYGLEYDVFPFRGASFLSNTHGYGLAIPTQAGGAPTNNTKRIPFRKDASAAWAPMYATVDPTSGNDGTGVASLTQATADASPFATISAAKVAALTKSALATGSGGRNKNDTGNIVIYLKSGTYVGYHGTTSNMSSGTKGDTWMIIQRHPSTTSSYADVVITPAASTSLKTGGRRVKFVEVTIQGNTTTAALDNQSLAPSNASEYNFETWFEGCKLTGAGTSQQRCMARMGLMWFTNCIFDGCGPALGIDAFSNIKLVAGGTMSASNLTGQSSNCTTVAVNVVGIIFSNGANMFNPSQYYCAEGTGSTTLPGPQLQTSMRAFNSFPTCKATPKDFNQTGTTGDLARAGCWMMNFVEVYSNAGVASSKGGELSADGTIRPIPLLYHLWNTYAGEGINLVYNENSVASNGAINETSPSALGCVQKRVIDRCNAYMDRNAKSDLYDSATPRMNRFRVGNWHSIHSVDRYKNALFGAGSFNNVAGPGNNAGEVFEATTLTGVNLDPKWVNDQSWSAPSGAKAGGGDYHPTSLSPHKGMISATDQCFPEDLSGTTRATNGNGCPGAFDLAS